MKPPRRFARPLTCLFAGATMLAPAPGRAESAPSDVPGLVREDLDLGWRPGVGWRFGGAFEIGSILERRFGLAADEPDIATLESSLDLAVAYLPRDDLSFYGELRLSHDRFLQAGDRPAEPETRVELRQAYLVLHQPWPGVSVQLGRQRFEDARGWWYDEQIDALRLHVDAGPAGIEVAAGRSEAVGRDLLGRERAGSGNNLMAVGRHPLGAAATAAAYVIAQDDRSAARERPLLFGLHAGGYGAGDVGYWVDAALVRGTDEGRPIRAFGFDCGAEIPLAVPFSPSLHLGLAFGSGDDDPLDGTDREFRQTGLQGTYFYYGEVMAPELSNLWIYTAGLEIEPGDTASMRLLFHRYRQDHAAPTLRDSLLDRSPDGRSRDLGVALDFVGSVEIADGAYLDLIVGAFEPGSAFGPDADRAYFGQLVFTFEFW